MGDFNKIKKYLSILKENIVETNNIIDNIRRKTEEIEICMNAIEFEIEKIEER